MLWSSESEVAKSVLRSACAMPLACFGNAVHRAPRGHLQHIQRATASAVPWLILCDLNSSKTICKTYVARSCILYKLEPESKNSHKTQRVSPFHTSMV